jgi:hypothetical protein
VTSFGGLLVHVSVIKDLRGFDNAETSGSYWHSTQIVEKFSTFTELWRLAGSDRAHICALSPDIWTACLCNTLQSKCTIFNALKLVRLFESAWYIADWTSGDFLGDAEGRAECPHTHSMLFSYTDHTSDNQSMLIQ